MINEYNKKYQEVFSEDFRKIEDLNTLIRSLIIPYIVSKSPSAEALGLDEEWRTKQSEAIKGVREQLKETYESLDRKLQELAGK